MSKWTFERFAEFDNFAMSDGFFTDFREAIVFDVETTGIDVENDRIVSLAAVNVSLAAVKVDFTKEGTHEFHGIYSVMNPGILIPKSATKIHGISNEDVNDKLPFRDYAEETLKFFGDMPIISHNVEFDVKILNRELIRAGYKPLQNRAFCTMKAMNRIFNDLEGRRLFAKWLTLGEAASYFDIEGRSSSTHKASEDVRITLEIAAQIRGHDNNASFSLRLAYATVKGFHKLVLNSASVILPRDKYRNKLKDAGNVPARKTLWAKIFFLVFSFFVLTGNC